MEVFFITGNKTKIAIAKEFFKHSKIKISHKKLDTPEIQSLDIKDVASFSARWAADKLNMPVIVTDAGPFIEALNGFPGPYAKDVFKMLSAEDLLKLMKGKKNRTVEYREAMVFCEPGKKPKVWIASVKGKLAQKTSKKSGSALDKIFIPKGYFVPEAEIPFTEMVLFWKNNLSSWDKIVKFLEKKYA